MSLPDLTSILLVAAAGTVRIFRDRGDVFATKAVVSRPMYLPDTAYQQSGLGTPGP